MKNMTLNDPNDVVLDVDEPWMNMPSFLTQKVEKELVQVLSPQQVKQNYSYTKIKVYFKAEDPNEIYSKNKHSASIQKNGKIIHLVVPMVHSNIKEFTQSFITDSKPPTKNDKLISERRNKEATSKPPSHAELKACAEAIPKIKMAIKKTRTFRLTFKEKSMSIHNVFSNESAKDNELVIYKKKYDHPIKSKKGNPYYDKEGNEVKLFSYCGYVEVGIEGTEIELREDTISNDTQSENDKFLNFIGKF